MTLVTVRRQRSWDASGVKGGAPAVVDHVEAIIMHLVWARSIGIASPDVLPRAWMERYSNRTLPCDFHDITVPLAETRHGRAAVRLELVGSVHVASHPHVLAGLVHGPHVDLVMSRCENTPRQSNLPTKTGEEGEGGR